ncbi:hypothetical protein ACFE04_019267 [Oxalis oulophora]
MTGLVVLTRGGSCGGGGGGGGGGKLKSNKVIYDDDDEENREEQNQVSVVELFLAALRKSMVSCRVDRNDDVMSTTSVAAATAADIHNMEIGWPTNVRHITHVTFDRFNGFLGLPVEFEVEIPGRVPSASASVFGVSAESMQCSFDSKGNSVPTILLLMQERLYAQEGLKAEGIFRINPENSQEEHVRDQLNRGIVPENYDVHCLAGLIKAWFRELPSGVLDGLSPEQVLDCNTEEDSVELVKQLKPTEAALLSWAVELMADVVMEEECNKMNARNIAMVFAPNMTQMSDPLTALMHAVQVMNLLKTLIVKTLREREEAENGGYSPMSSHSSNPPTDKDYDSQHEMDTSCELRGPVSDYDIHSQSGEEEDESLSEVEDSFLRQMDENKTATNSFREQTAGNEESSISFIDNNNNKNENSGLTSSDDEEDFGPSMRAEEQIVILSRSPPRQESEIIFDVRMLDKVVEPTSPIRPHSFS